MLEGPGNGVLRLMVMAMNRIIKLPLSLPEVLLPNLERQYPELDQKLSLLCRLDRDMIRMEAMSFAMMRRHYFLSQTLLGPRHVSIEDIINQRIPCKAGHAIPMRIYRPKTLSPRRRTIFYIHGGGWSIGGINTYDGVLRQLSAKTGAQVVAVGYRLSPEHPFPAAPNDCYDAWRWLLHCREWLHLDTENLAIVGDSAGANLALNLSRRLTAAGTLKPKFIGLVYPSLDLGLDSPSWKTLDKGLLLSKVLMRRFVHAYAPQTHQWQHPDLSPMMAHYGEDFPKCLIFTAEMDPLRDEGRLFADRLRDSGCDVTYKQYQKLVHGFLGLAGAIPLAARAFHDICFSIKETFH
ncbi:MAG: alpha/beta hydrolase [Pseudobacteriovorax sp.]|nr:alpha/beta hydrolase [Pseudobacteriovorax sp.]